MNFKRPFVLFIPFTSVLLLFIWAGATLRPVAADPVAAACDFNNQVNADSPFGYWRLGEEGTITMTNSGTLGTAVDGSLVGSGAVLGVSSLISVTDNNAIEFDGTDASVLIPNNNAINTSGPYTAKTIELWFKANAPLSGLQMIYEQGGGSRGLNIYLNDDQLYLNGWNIITSDGAGDGWGPLYITETIQPGATYHLVMLFEGESAADTFDGTISGYLNGRLLNSVTGIGRLYSHADPVAIGGVAGSTYYHTGGGGLSYFNGIVDEVVLYSTLLSEQRILAHYANCNKQSGPVAVADLYFIDEDETLTTTAVNGVQVNDVDLDSDVLTTTLYTAPLSGTAVLAADGSFIYTPTLDFNGIDTFAYALSDGTQTSTTTVEISVAAVNDQPVANNDTYTTAEDTPLTILGATGVFSNDFDIDNDNLSAMVIVPPSHGNLIFENDGGFTYTPEANFYGVDSFVYQLSDGELVDTGFVTLNVTAENDPPIAQNDNYVVLENTPLNVPAPGVLQNDSDLESSSLTAAVLQPPSSGSLLLNSNGSFSYTPAADFIGVVTFTYSASDGELSDTAVVTLTVTDQNEAPVAQNDSYAVPRDNVLTVPAVEGLLSNDSDPENSNLSLTGSSMPQHGQLALKSDGSFVYTPTTNYVGSDSFTYTVSDGLLTDTATVNLTVAQVLTIAPVSQPVMINTVITLTGSFTDLSGNGIDTIAWDFGDASSAADALVITHSYTTAATYTVTLTVTDHDGFTHRATTAVTVVDEVIEEPPTIYLPVIVGS